MISLKNSRQCRRTSRQRRGHVVGEDAALYLPGPLGPSEGSGARSTRRGSLPEDHCLRGPESSRNCTHRAQAELKLRSWAGMSRPESAQGRRPRRDSQAAPARPRAARSPGMRLRGRVRSRRGPARPHSWMDPGQEPRRASPQPPPVAQEEPTARSRPPQSHVPPTALTLLRPATREGPGCARGGCARRAPGCRQGSGCSSRRSSRCDSLAAAAAAARSSSKFP